MKFILLILGLILLIGIASATVPVISNVSNDNPMGYTVRIDWDTDIITNNTVKYSLNSDMSSPLWSEWVNSTSNVDYVMLFNLELNKTYYYQAFSYNGSDNSNSTVQSFESLPWIIRKNTSAIILWNVNNSAATGQVEYGLDTGYGSTTDVKKVGYWHYIEITGLSEGTTYQYRLRGNNYKGTVNTPSINLNFTTSSTLTHNNTIKAARVDGLMPKIYYVKNGGNNGDTGLSLGNAWETPAYAASQSDAGDIIYVVNGTYVGGVDFGYLVGNPSGIPEAPITMKAYNGTPDITGRIDIRSNYVTFDGFICRDAGGHGIDARDPHGIKILNCEVHDTVGGDGIYFRDVLYSLIENTTMNNTGWNAMGIKPSAKRPTMGYNVIVRNCSAYDNLAHNSFDVQGDYMTYEDLYSNNSLLAPLQTVGQKVVINNLTGAFGNNGIKLIDYFDESVIMNCALPDNPIMWAYGDPVDDVTIYNNYVSYANYGILMSTDTSILLEENEIDTQETSGYTYRINDLGSATVRDDATPQYKVKSNNGATITIEYTNGKVFTESGAGSPKWYPSLSNYSFSVISTVTITSYNITLKPTSDYLKDIVVNSESNISNDQTNITVNSSVAENPTWINATMQNATNTYNISRDGIYYDSVVSDSDSIARYYYNISGNEWSTHDFEFTWANTTGWNPIPDTPYLDRRCTYYTNGSIICHNVEQGDTIMAVVPVVT